VIHEYEFLQLLSTIVKLPDHNFISLHKAYMKCLLTAVTVL